MRVRGSIKRFGLVTGFALAVAGCAAGTAGGTLGDTYLTQQAEHEHKPGNGVVLIKTEVDGVRRSYAVVLAQVDPKTNEVKLRDGQPVTARLAATPNANPKFGTPIETGNNGAYHLISLPAGSYVLKNFSESLTGRDWTVSCLFESSIAFDVSEDGVNYVGDVRFDPAIKQKGEGLVVVRHVKGPARIVGVSRDAGMAQRYLARYPALSSASLIESPPRDVSLPAGKTMFGKAKC